ncbi:MAG: hypothetical protein ACRDD7_05145 [Peptostreptococcaceae bacterium]
MKHHDSYPYHGYNSNCQDYYYNCNHKCHDHHCHCHCCDYMHHKKPSYGAFWQSEFITVDINQAFPFNFTGPTTTDISLLNPTTIKVNKAGVYQIYYRVAVDVTMNSNPANFVDQRISLYVNNVQQPDTQGSFGILAPDIRSCVPISGQAIISIPANATLQLKNDGIYTGSSSISTCDNGVNAVTFNIVRID